MSWSYFKTICHLILHLIVFLPVKAITDVYWNFSKPKPRPAYPNGPRNGPRNGPQRGQRKNESQSNLIDEGRDNWRKWRTEVRKIIWKSYLISSAPATNVLEGTIHVQSGFTNVDDYISRTDNVFVHQISSEGVVFIRTQRGSEKREKEEKKMKKNKTS